MGHLNDNYLLAEGWLELGDFREAELALQQLPARARATQRGLRLWLRLSLALERWPEIEAAARQLRSAFPADISLILHEAVALQQQGKGLQSLSLLADNARFFTGPAWPQFLATLESCAVAASLPAAGANLLHCILTSKEQLGELPSTSDPARTKPEPLRFGRLISR